MTIALDPFASPREVARLIRSGEVSAADVAHFYLDRIDRLDPRLKTVVDRDPEALARAAEADRDVATGRPLPPFHGVPLLIKDVQNQEGRPNTKSSLAVSDAPQPRSDIFIERLLAAGFVPLGRSASSELAAGPFTESIKNGQTLNPWDPELSPAGSSGGSAAAIAAGLVPAATATDGAGSTRLPAAACGLVGLKPSRGVLPQRIPNWEGSSVDGFVTRTVVDTAALFDVVAGPDLGAWFPRAAPPARYVEALGDDIRPLTVGILTEAPNGARVEPALLDATLEVAEHLRADGHRLVTVEPEIVAGNPAFQLYSDLVGPAGSHLLDYDMAQPMQESVRRRLALVDAMDVRSYVRAVAEVKRLVRDAIQPWFTRFDLLLTPTTAGLTPAHGEVLRDVLDPSAGQPVLRGVNAFTSWVNVLGLPAISLPTHLDPRGAPLGVQLIGGPLTEELLLGLAARLERIYAWDERRPAWLERDPDLAGS